MKDAIEFGYPFICHIDLFNFCQHTTARDLFNLHTWWRWSRCVGWLDHVDVWLDLNGTLWVVNNFWKTGCLSKIIMRLERGINFGLYLVLDVCCFREIIRISGTYSLLKGPLEEFGIYAPLQANKQPSNRPTDSHGTLSCIYGVLEVVLLQFVSLSFLSYLLFWFCVWFTALVLGPRPIILLILDNPLWKSLFPILVAEQVIL